MRELAERYLEAEPPLFDTPRRQFANRTESTAGPSRLRQRLAILLATSCAIGSLAFAIAASIHWAEGEYWHGFWALALSCIAITILGAGIRDDVLHPNSVIAVLFFFVFGLGTIRHFENGSTYSAQIVFSAILGLWSFAIANWATGYGARTSVATPTAAESYITNSLRIYLWALLFAAAISTVYIYLKVGIPALATDGLVSRLLARQEVTSYVVYLARMAQFAAYFFFIAALISPTRNSLFFVFAVIVFVVAINLTMGWRGPAFFILITLVFIFHYANAKRHTSLVITAISITLLTVTAWGYVRLFAHSAGDETGTVSYLQSMSSDSLSMFLNWVSLQFSNYAAGFQQVIALKETDPSIFGPTVFQHTLATFLPGQQMSFDQTLKLLSYSDFDGDGLNATLLGEAYADFGTYGVAAYCAGLGAVSGLTYKRVCERATHFRLIVHAFVMSVLILGTLTGIFGQAIYWVLAATLLGARCSTLLGTKGATFAFRSQGVS